MLDAMRARKSLGRELSRKKPLFEILLGVAFLGAILFYLSDLAVARHRFVKAEFLNRGIGLPLYYAGQVLIAMAV
jgi:hypothetical protein